jgi:hypothetical protein
MNSDKSVTQRPLYSGDRNPDLPAPAALFELDCLAIQLSAIRDGGDRPFLARVDFYESATPVVSLNLLS